MNPCEFLCLCLENAKLSEFLGRAHARHIKASGRVGWKELASAWSLQYTLMNKFNLQVCKAFVCTGLGTCIEVFVYLETRPCMYVYVQIYTHTVYSTHNVYHTST